MKTVTVANIKKFAENYAASGKKWHFHILTPDCQLNDSKQFALILENSTDKEVLVCYSEKPYMDIGKHLVQLLHGKDVVNNNKSNKENIPSVNVQRVLEKASKLNQEGRFWHHHMLFPYCMFNKHQGKWTIVFEDQDNNETVESVSDFEPKDDLKFIETLFYSQKK